MCLHFCCTLRTASLFIVVALSLPLTMSNAYNDTKFVLKVMKKCEGRALSSTFLNCKYIRQHDHRSYSNRLITNVNSCGCVNISETIRHHTNMGNTLLLQYKLDSNHRSHLYVPTREGVLHLSRECSPSQRHQPSLLGTCPLPPRWLGHY